MKAFDAVCKQTWAITPEYLRTILEIAARQNPTPEAVAAKLGRPLDNSHEVTVRDGVATIPVEGPLFRKANLFTRISGASAIGTLATDFNAALDDPSIKGIILYVDSPGGEVNGTSEFAQMIYEARERKPVAAFIADFGCSAAYWIASAADEVVVADTATVGSIGVIAAVRDPSKDDSTSIEFVSSQSPNKRPDVSSESGKAQIQAMVDDLGAVFIDAVARNRGVDADTVAADFGRGGVFIGRKAVDAGLADSVGTYEGLLQSFADGPDVGDVHVPGPMNTPARKRRQSRGIGAEIARAELAKAEIVAAAERAGLEGIGAAVAISLAADAFATEAGAGAAETSNAATGAGEAPAAPTLAVTTSDADAFPHETDTIHTRTQEQAMSEPIIPTTPAVAADELADLRAALAEERSRRESTQAELARTREAAEQATARVAAIERTERLRGYAELAKAWHGDTEAHVDFLDQLPSEELRQAYIDRQDANAVALGEALKQARAFEPAGYVGHDAGSSALERLNAHAAAIRSREPGLTEAQAFTRACREHPEDYDAYGRETR